ncbi:hypothetical protein BABINDRAFT_163345 [Babjeviella inositovora NRRL Y-12698]|uniref:SP-RING-type domain-containing protein n=1 Tax=Babjeviella inositovora NRRL Y-12698 TaxID=984486 RepID=A0A1E3QIS9_9ASCO|nr:uncharacterized protein BABINDRAFT_163345 [Babjeviella inositovora NRRL Y-12698]ODQ77623.1 hypothetical protein BABINDRAFT_163345 [Babjeviella inositovora NRRL Y-12698]
MSDELNLTYYPLHESLASEFDKIRVGTSTAHNLKQEMEDLLRYSMLFLETIATDAMGTSLQDGPLGEELLKQASEMLVSMQTTQDAQNSMFAAVSQTKATFRNTTREEPPLQLEYLQHYQNIPLDETHRSLTQMLDDLLAQQPAPQRSAALEEDIHFLNNAAFVIQHPLEPLPETEEDEDDLAMAGGKVDLYDPLLRKLFVDPYYSKKCRHVFEKGPVHELMRQEHSREIDCPTMGCGMRISAKDLVPDKLMKLRVLAYNQQQNASKDAEEMVKL